MFQAVEDAILLSPLQGALTQLFVAVDSSMAGVSGKYYKPIATEGTISAIAADSALAARLWDVSLEQIRSFVAQGEGVSAKTMQQEQEQRPTHMPSEVPTDTSTNMPSGTDQHLKNGHHQLQEQEQDVVADENFVHVHS